eukprot:10084575-Heterocapsa_arctica.AAC.1
MQGEARGHTNTWIRAQLHLPTVASDLRAQRTQWLKSPMKRPSHNAILLAALAGSSVWDNLPPLDEQGVPRPTANPWLHQAWNAVLMLQSSSRSPFSLSQGWLSLPEYYHFFFAPLSALFSFREEHVTPPFRKQKPRVTSDALQRDIICTFACFYKCKSRAQCKD